MLFKFVEKYSFSRSILNQNNFFFLNVIDLTFYPNKLNDKSSRTTNIMNVVITDRDIFGMIIKYMVGNNTRGIILSLNKR